MQNGKHDDEAVQVIRAANAGDGEDFDEGVKQLLLRMPDGTKKIVLASEVTIDPTPEMVRVAEEILAAAKGSKS